MNKSISHFTYIPKVESIQSSRLRGKNTYLKLVRFELMSQHPHDRSELGGGDLAGALLVDPHKRISEESQVRQYTYQYER